MLVAKYALRLRGLPLARGSHAVAAVLLLGGGSCDAVEGGFSNYIPGFYGDLALAVAPPEGVSMRNDIYYYSGDANGTVRSTQLELDVEVTLLFDYLTFVYNPGVDLFGGSLVVGATAVIGSIDVDATIAVGNRALDVEDDTVGLGDLTLAANIYWPRDKWNFLWANYVVAPVGSYDVDDAANSGLNYWTFETDFMATYLDMEKGRDYSIVVGYTYNVENDDTNYKSGDEFHVDFVLNQFLSEKFAVGINGYFYRQLSGDSGDGALLGSFKGEAAGIGPALYYVANLGGRDIAFTAKWISEFDTKNRLDGDHVFASFAMSF